MDLRGGIIFASAALAVLATTACTSKAPQKPAQSLTLEEGFKNPPAITKPAVYWYWLNDNISKDGALKDLEAMNEVGIGTVFIGNIGNQAGEFGKVPFNSQEWWDVMRASLKKAGELGIDIGIFNSPGWSQSGGPWITPERSMRYLAYSEIKVKGGAKIEEKLPVAGENFEDVRVIAFKAPKDDGVLFSALKPAVTSAPAIENIALLADGAEDKSVFFDGSLKTAEIYFAAQQEFSARGLTFILSSYTKADAELFAKINGEWKSVKSFKINRTHHRKLVNIVGFKPYAPLAFALPAVNAKEFKLKLTNIEEAAIAEVRLSSAAPLEYYAEKQLAKMHPNPAPDWYSYMWPAQAALDVKEDAVPSAEVLDISKYMSKDGTLVWNAPKGEWIIQRLGMLSSGVTNNPASGSARGLETDKMSKAHIAYHFDSYMGEVLKRVPAEDRKTFKYVVQDSYETGSQNWTDGFGEEFKARYGYDPLKFAPVLSGRIVDSPEISDRFLWDLRRLIADKVAYDYVAGLREASHKNGLKTWLECYGHWGFPAEFLQYGGQSDFVAGEFWNEGLGTVENRAASSCVHTYGKGLVWSESFTAGGKDYQRSPAMLKRRGDLAFTEGVNKTLLHVYMHQPYEDKTPGVNAWFSTEFNRKNTWFFMMKPFVKYMQRCMFMLQQGVNVADIAYFIGEDTPKMTGVAEPALPYGRNFDYINAEVICGKLEVKDGEFVLPHGTSYKLLVLPPQETMRIEVLKKIKKLAEDGGTVLGPKPLRSPSLQDYPQCDAEVKKLADELWGNVDGANVKFRKVGKGIIASNLSAEEALKLAGCPNPDFASDNKKLAYVHRTDGETQIYFVSNQDGKDAKAETSFRVQGLAPELWDPLSGDIRPLPAFSQTNGMTTVPLEFARYGSAFIVFRKTGMPTAAGFAGNFPPLKTLAEISADWKVDFANKTFGPKETLVFNKLEDWSKSANAEVKYYSGEASYKNSFTLKGAAKFKKIAISLGDVQALAEVKINGQYAGGVWTHPYVLDITPFVKEGVNTIEVNVVNTWVNRLVGDALLPPQKRYTWLLVNPFKPETKLMPSGLLGPVKVEGLE